MIACYGQKWYNCYEVINVGNDYYEKNREAILQQKREYYAKHREEIRKKQQDYYNANAEQFNLRAKQWRDENVEHRQAYLEKTKDKRKAQNAEWREKNKVKLAAKMRQYRRDNPEAVRKHEKNRKNIADRKAKFNIYHTVWKRMNPDKVDRYWQSRRARLFGGENDLTQQDIRDQRSNQQGKCYYCGNDLDNNGRGHIEHKTPLCRGGGNTKDNIVVACSSCNLRKGKMTEEEYREHLSD